MCNCSDSLCRGSLGFHRGEDPPLYDMYAKKLLIKGWAGIYTPSEETFRQRGKPPTAAQKASGARLVARRAQRLKGETTVPDETKA